MATVRTDKSDDKTQRTESKPPAVRGELAPSPATNSLPWSASPVQATPAPPHRMPRGSMAPPASDTVVTPAPVSAEAVVAAVFDEPGSVPMLAADQVELLEDSGLLQFDQPVAEVVEEVSSSFLIEDLDGSEAAPVGVLEEVQELGSENLAFVEARGEILGPPTPARPISEGPSVRVSSLHQEAVELGVPMYGDAFSNGIPSTSLNRDGQLSQTLQIRRESVFQRHGRNALIALVFLAGIGAGVLFATNTDSSPAPVPAAAPGIAPEQAEHAIVPETDSVGPTEVEIQAPPPEVEHQDPPDEVEGPVVAPLIEDQQEEAQNQGQEIDTQGEEPDQEVEDTPAEEDPPQVRPLGEDAVPEESGVPSRKRRTPSRVKTTSVPKPIAPAKGTADPGVLMLAAKPPCEIRIDGKDTGLSTPQRKLRLSPGKHRVTLTNHEHKIRETFKVSIESGKKTKVVRDITSKIKSAGP